MTRKRCPRKPRPALPPPGLRRKLSAAQIRDLALAHITNLDAISHGQADEETLWQWVGGALTWSRAAELIAHEEAMDAMRRQLDVCTSVIQRYGRTGRLGFTGPEYQQAREACEWMDAIAEHIDHYRACQAADWSEARVNRWRMQGDCTASGPNPLPPNPPEATPPAAAAP